MKHPIIRHQAPAKPTWGSATLDNPLPCPWPGAEKRGAAYLCWHCHGTGELRHFSHVANGVCFTCKGRGWQYSPRKA